MSLNQTMEDSHGQGTMSLVSRFNGKEFPIWKKKMLAYLALKGLAKVVTEEKEEFSKDKEYESKRHSAYALLLLSLSNDQARLIMDVPFGDANGLWKSLLQIYECKTTLSLVYTRRLLYGYKMSKVESFDSYLARLKELTGKLEDMGEKISNSEAIFILLNGLPDDYSSIVSAMEINDKITFQAACDNIRNYQEKLRITEQTANVIAGKLSIGSANYAGEGEGKPKCFTCGKPGHKSVQCKLNEDKERCEFCEKIGHTIDRCRIKAKVKETRKRVEL
jgi:hypothetical protein